MCVEYCVKISDKSDKKWKSYSVYNLSSLTLLPVVIFERAHWSEGREWDNGVMYCFFLLSCPMIFLRTFLTCNMQRKQSGRTPWFSTTRDLTRLGYDLCTLHAWLSLAVVRDISKLDWTGQKVNRLRNRWAYINVFGFIWKRKNPAIT